MSVKHLLPCSCGEMLPVEPGQAGERLTCPACQTKVVAPTMRELRRLPVLAESGRAEAAPWSRTQGLLFALGLPLVLLGWGVAAWMLFARAGLDVTKPEILLNPAWDEEIESWTADRLWTEWTPVREMPLGARETPQYLLNREQAQRLLLFAGIGLAVGVVGAAMAAGAFFVRSGPAPPGRRPRTTS